MRRRPAQLRSQNLVEVVLLVALVGLGVAWLTTKLPDAIRAYHVNNQQVVASPL